MDRIINITVNGNRLTKDSNSAGTRGEANVTTLRITFSESWDGYAKSVLFLDAHGLNPTRRTLTADLLENIEKSTRIYLLPIPKEPLGLAGEMSFSIEGYVDGKRQRSVTGTLEVEDAVITDVVNDPTPTQMEEMQSQYESIMDDIQQTALNKTATEGYKEEAKVYAKTAADSLLEVEGYANEASTQANQAIEAKNTAEAAVTHVLELKSDVEALKQQTIDEATVALENIKQETEDALNKDAETALENIKQETIEALNQEATDVMVALGEKTKGEVEAVKQSAIADVEVIKAEATEEAQKAKESAEDAEEFANKAENALGKTSYIGENGNWYAWDNVKDAFYDTGVKAQAGSEVYIGDNPPASADVWIDPNGEPDDIISRINKLERNIEKLIVRTVTITLFASEWVNDGDKYSQIVTIADVTPYSKVNLQPSADQLVIFYEKDVTFVTENEGGVITVFCIGQKPTNDYVMQATITEVK